ncbi:hypothetical protein CALVIDRAFT_536370 [Calocera viscosa TUFC12733]|uniref:Uncharacterized protein n=1 Tax=Calocera viscosa (strain TUFC12733) TaxID=1330018 RepID=A0A167N5A8_CALVF|nr:hypothetical protein CALVIDRAFT_536370 [Calocera viscosa TUFC12733]
MGDVLPLPPSSFSSFTARSSPPQHPLALLQHTTQCGCSSPSPSSSRSHSPDATALYALSSELMDPPSPGGPSKPAALRLSPKSRATFNPLTISPLPSPLASPTTSRSSLQQQQTHGRHPSHPPGPRRKAHSAWSSRSSSPSRAAAAAAAVGGSGGGGGGGGGGEGGEGDAFTNRPRSKSTASLSAYFGASPVAPYDLSSLGAGYGFSRAGAEEEEEEEEPLLFAGPSSFPAGSGFPRVRSMTDMPSLSFSPHPPAYSRTAPTSVVEALSAFGGEARQEVWRDTAGPGLLNRSARGGRRAKPVTVRSDTETETEPLQLPTARKPPPKTDKPPLAHRLVPLFMFFCRGLSIVPAVLGTGWHLYLAYKIPWRFGRFGASHDELGEGAGVGMGGMDHAIVSCWSIATGVWCYLLASGLLRRWLTYYSLFPTLIRQLSLQAICWSSTHLTTQVFGPSRPLTAWVVIGTTTSISHSVQIWVTSNIRLASKDAEESRRWFAVGMGLDYWLGKRKIDWSKVVRQSVIPLFVLYFVTCWTMLLDRELLAR